MDRAKAIEAASRLRSHLRTIDDAIEDAQLALDDLEQAIGIVREDGSSEYEPAGQAERAKTRVLGSFRADD